MGVVLFVLCVIIIIDNLLTRGGTPKKDDLDKKNEDKPKISPPVHSMLELMLKCPEEFEPIWDKYYDGECWKHTPSSTCFTINTSWKGNAFYYINTCSVTQVEGEYLLQGVEFLQDTRKLKQEQANKERRHKVDREIRKVLEEKQL